MIVYAVMHEIWVDYMECGVESLFDTKEKAELYINNERKSGRLVDGEDESESLLFIQEMTVH